MKVKFGNYDQYPPKFRDVIKFRQANSRLRSAEFFRLLAEKGLTRLNIELANWEIEHTTTGLGEPDASLFDQFIAIFGQFTVAEAVPIAELPFIYDIQKFFEEYEGSR